MSFGLEQQTQRFMAFGTECKLDNVLFFIFFVGFIELHAFCAEA